jgi:hypothetical protein
MRMAPDLAAAGHKQSEAPGFRAGSSKPMSPGARVEAKSDGLLRRDDEGAAQHLLAHQLADGGAPPIKRRGRPPGAAKSARNGGEATPQEHAAQNGHGGLEDSGACAGEEVGQDHDENQYLIAGLPELLTVDRASRAQKRALAVRIAAMDLPTVIDGLVSLHREHRALQRAVGDMTRRIKADEKWAAHARHVRDGIEIPAGKMAVPNDDDAAFIKTLRHRLYTGRAALEALRKQVQAEQLMLVTRLPVYDWALSIRGFGLASLAAIVGEAGDIGKYGNPAKFWKRMGLAVIDGERQRKVAGNPELAERHGFRPQRRAEVHVIGENLIRQKSPGYYELYVARKEYEQTRPDPVPYLIVAHKRALRYVEKRLLKKLWSAWRVGTGVAGAEPEGAETGVLVMPNEDLSQPQPEMSLS